MGTELALHGPKMRNPRWRAVIAAYVEGKTSYAELAEVAKVTKATIASYFRDDEFALLLTNECETVRKMGHARLIAMQSKALDVVDESLTNGREQVGKTRAFCAAELVLSRTLPVPRDNGAIAAAAAGGAAGAVAALASLPDADVLRQYEQALAEAKVRREQAIDSTAEPIPPPLMERCVARSDREG